MKFIKTHQPCPLCKSSDAYSIREDGSGMCFSCGKGQTGKKENMTIQQIKHTYRGVTPETFNKFKVLGTIDDGDLKSLVFTRPNGQKLFKSTEKKEFWFKGTVGSGLSLFGSDVFLPGTAKAVTITEGYLDALSSYQMLGKHPTVAVQSTSTAKAECAKAYEYLNSFDKIYIAFDADTPGRKAADEVSRLFDFNKVYIVQLSPEMSDPNGYLVNNKTSEYTKAWWAAQRFLPEGILSSFSAFDEVFDNDILKPSISYPWETLQDLTYGIRTGELVLLTAMEGIGKTEIFRALEYNVLKETDSNVGIIHLEENKARTLKGLVGYELQAPVHLPDFSVSKEELKKTIRAVSGRDDRVHIYSHFGSDDPDVLLSTIRFMAGSCDCKYIFLDHITMAVTGLQGEDERKALDYLSTRLAMMTEELDFCLFMISHVNDDGKTRGSRNISKVANIRIDLHRDLTAEDPELRNRTTLTVSKNRFSGKTGPGGVLVFDPATYCMNEFLPEEVF